MEDSILLYEQRGPVAILTLNRPAKMNALSQPLVTELRDRIRTLQDDERVRVIIITGSGRAFSAGYDLTETRNNPVKGPVAWRKRLGNDVSTAMAIWDCTKPVIAAVNGYCLGGGCDLALMCDLTLAAESATFGEPEIRFASGVVTLIMPWVLGMKKTREFLYTGHDGLSARQAEALGLVNRVVPDDSLLDEAVKLALEIAVIDPIAIGLTKMAINRTYETMGFREAIQANLDLDIHIETAETPERVEFSRIVREQGLKAALIWREQRFAGPWVRGNTRSMSHETFRALVLNQVEGRVQAEVQNLSQSALPEGDVLVAVEFSSLNYKDGLAVTGLGKVVRQYPMIPGIDLAGTVVESLSPDYRTGDKVLVTGWGVGERHWGGYAQLARVSSDWLVPVPGRMTTHQAMVLGTAGLTAMLCVMSLVENGVRPGGRPIAVTGAGGGVGSVAVGLLANLGYWVTAFTGRPETKEYLTRLGAHEVRDRSTLAAPPAGALESERWGGALDTVGGEPLAALLRGTAYGGVVACCGLAAGTTLNTTVFPFILRGVSLVDIDSVMCPQDRRTTAWEHLAQELPPETLDQISQTVPLSEIPAVSQEILKGRVRGRIVVDVNQ